MRNNDNKSSAREEDSDSSRVKEEMDSRRTEKLCFGDFKINNEN